MFGVQNSQAKLQSLAHPKVGVLYKMFHVSVSERLLAFVIARKGHGKCMLHIQDLVSGFWTHALHQAYYYNISCFLGHFKCSFQAPRVSLRSVSLTGEWDFQTYTKGKPSGPRSAPTSAFFHTRCRCRSRNVVQWFLLILN